MDNAWFSKKIYEVLQNKGSFSEWNIIVIQNQPSAPSLRNVIEFFNCLIENLVFKIEKGIPY